MTTIDTQDKVYGPKHAPRVKWKCTSCKKRNDHAVLLPVGEKTVFVCRQCKRATILGFTAAPTTATAAL